MAYDPHLRRNTPLLSKLKDDVRRLGPLSVERYMRSCLFDTEHGYYKNAKVLGRDGDFITAPEISQTFGELVGLWCVAVWSQMGEPGRVQVVELGAGRGTLLADALRAAQRVPAFFEAVSVAIIDTHPGLRKQQAKTLNRFSPRTSWRDDVTALDAVPTIVIANEFLDCLPVAQFVASPDTPPGWHRRRVGLDNNDQLQFMRDPFDPTANAKTPTELAGFEPVPRAAMDGDIIETRAFAGSDVAALQDFAFGNGTDTLPLAGLFIDYGHTQSSVGDTLQAVRAHSYEHPLTSPGEADLTAHVDFEQFAQAMRQDDFAIDGPITQGAFLGRLGIVERASQLIAHNPDQAANVEAAVARLISPTGMGGRFQAMAIRSPDLAPLPGLSS